MLVTSLKEVAPVTIKEFRWTSGGDTITGRLYAHADTVREAKLMQWDRENFRARVRVA